MQLKRLSIGAALAMLFLAAGPADCPAAQSQQMGWILNLTSEVEGNQVIYLTPTAIKIDSMTFTIIVQAPKFTTSIYNNRAKIYASSTYDRLKNKLSPKGELHHDRKVRQGGSGTIAGMKVTQFFLNRIKHLKFEQEAEFWTTRELQVAQPIIECFCVICEVPADYGMPLKVIKIHRNGKTIAVNTVSCRRTAIPQSTFKGPTAYRKVDDEMTVLSGDTSVDDILSK